MGPGRPWRRGYPTWRWRSTIIIVQPRNGRTAGEWDIIGRGRTNIHVHATEALRYRRSGRQRHALPVSGPRENLFEEIHELAAGLIL
jgi:hypothetical protein